MNKNANDFWRTAILDSHAIYIPSTDRDPKNEGKTAISQSNTTVGCLMQLDNAKKAQMALSTCIRHPIGQSVSYSSRQGTPSGGPAGQPESADGPSTVLAPMARTSSDGSMIVSKTRRRDVLATSIGFARTGQQMLSCAPSTGRRMSSPPWPARAPARRGHASYTVTVRSPYGHRTVTVRSPYGHHLENKAFQRA